MALDELARALMELTTWAAFGSDEGEVYVTTTWRTSQREITEYVGGADRDT
jgi:hypothetical protein